jgi:hypothetical protein
MAKRVAPGHQKKQTWQAKEARNGGVFRKKRKGRRHAGTENV